jgi:hypothetical protein
VRRHVGWVGRAAPAGNRAANCRVWSGTGGRHARPGPTARWGWWINGCVQVRQVKLSQVLELAVQITRDWVSDRPRWGRVEWSRCAAWAVRVPETTQRCQGQLEHLRQLLERGQLSPGLARTPAFPLVAEALATDLVVRLWLCCWARQALEQLWDGSAGEPEGWARGTLPEALPGILQRLGKLRQAVLEMLLALQVTAEWTEPPPELDLERLRREVERWTDRLTGTLVVGWGRAEFCLHPTRALAWGAERRLWTGAEGPVTPWEGDLLGVRALGPACRLPAGAGDELRRGVLSLLSGSVEPAVGEVSGRATADPGAETTAQKKIS